MNTARSGLGKRARRLGRRLGWRLGRRLGWRPMGAWAVALGVGWGCAGLLAIAAAQDGAGAEQDAQVALAAAVARRDYAAAAALQARQRDLLGEDLPVERWELDPAAATRRGGAGVDDSGQLVLTNNAAAAAEWGPLRGLTGYFRLVATVEAAEPENLRGELFLQVMPASSTLPFQRVVIPLRQIEENRLAAGPLFFDSSGRGLLLGVATARRDRRERPSGEENGGGDENGAEEPVREPSPDLARLADLALEPIPDPGADPLPRLAALRGMYDQAFRGQAAGLALSYHQALTALAAQRQQAGDGAGARRAATRAEELANQFQLAVAGREHAALVLDWEQARTTGDEVRVRGDGVVGFEEEGDGLSWNTREVSLPTRRLRVRVLFRVRPDEQGLLKVSLAPHQQEFDLSPRPDQDGGELETAIWTADGAGQTLKLEYDPRSENARGLVIERVELIPVE